MIDPAPPPYRDLWLEPGGRRCGFALVGRAPSARLPVVLLADDASEALLRADQGSPPIPTGPDAGRRPSFALRRDGARLAAARRIVAGSADHERIFGAVDLGEGEGRRTISPCLPDHIARGGRTRSIFYLRQGRDGEPSRSVLALIDDREAAWADVRSWIEISDDAVARRFHLDLPLAYAVGRATVLDAMTSDGVPPDARRDRFVARPDAHVDRLHGWADLESGSGGAHLAGGFPPLSEIEVWLACLQLPRLAGSTGDRDAVARVRGERQGPTGLSREGQSGIAWHAATVSRNETPVGAAQPLRRTLRREASGCRVVVVAVVGAPFALDALDRLAEAAALFPTAAAVDPHLLATGCADRRWTLAPDAPGPEHVFEAGYCGLVYAVWRPVLRRDPGHALPLSRMAPGGSPGPIEARPVHIASLRTTVPNVPQRCLLDPLATAARARLMAAGEPAEMEIPRDPVARSIRIRRDAPHARLSPVVALRDSPTARERSLVSLEPCLGRGLDEAVPLLGPTEAYDGRVPCVSGWSCPPCLLSLAIELAQSHLFISIGTGVLDDDEGCFNEVQGSTEGYRRHRGPRQPGVGRRARSRLCPGSPPRLGASKPRPRDRRRRPGQPPRRDAGPIAPLCGPSPDAAPAPQRPRRFRCGRVAAAPVRARRRPARTVRRGRSLAQARARFGLVVRAVARRGGLRLLSPSSDSGGSPALPRPRSAFFALSAARSRATGALAFPFGLRRRSP